MKNFISLLAIASLFASCSDNANEKPAEFNSATNNLSVCNKLRAIFGQPSPQRPVVLFAVSTKSQIETPEGVVVSQAVPGKAFTFESVDCRTDGSVKLTSIYTGFWRESNAAGKKTLRPDPVKESWFLMSADGKKVTTGGINLDGKTQQEQELTSEFSENSLKFFLVIDDSKTGKKSCVGTDNLPAACIFSGGTEYKIAQGGELQVLSYASAAFFDANGKPLKETIYPSSIRATSNLNHAKALSEPFEF